jgi:hypothetical protein
MIFVLGRHVKIFSGEVVLGLHSRASGPRLPSRILFDKHDWQAGRILRP